MRTPIFRFPAAAVIFLAAGTGFPPVTQAETKDKSHPERKAAPRASGTAKPAKNAKPAARTDDGDSKPAAIAPLPEAVPPPPVVRAPANKAEEADQEREKESPAATAGAPAAEAPVDTRDSTGEEEDSEREEKEEGGSAPFNQSREAASRAKLNALLPPGSTHRGVYYPSFRPVPPDAEQPDAPGGAGASALPGMEEALASVFRGETVTRLDNDHVEVSQANWVQYDEKPWPDGTPRPAMTMDLEQGVYNLKTQILISNQPVRIENQGMVMVGDTMVHDRVSGLTHIEGRARIVFFDEEESPPPTAAAAPPAGN